MKYPTRNGRIVSPYELGLTRPTPEQTAVRGLTNIHHGAFNRDTYMATPIRRIFRGLINNTFLTIVTEHHDLHEDFDAPKVPEDAQMIEQIEEHLYANDVITCRYEKHTKDTYTKTYDEWQCIKGIYQRRIKQ